MTTILGYTWDEINAVQHKTGTLSKRIDTSKPATIYDKDNASKDLELLSTHGKDKLREMGYFGVLDRLTRAGLI